MKHRSKVALCSAVALTALVSVVGSASAAHVGNVYTMTNSTDPARGNEVVVYNRQADGSLTYNMRRATGGVGSGPAPTSVVFGIDIPATADGIGSQEGLVLNPKGTQIFAVNSGSDSVTCLPIESDGSLGAAVTVDSGGVFPASLAVRGKHIAVLNSGNVGNITTFNVGSDCGMERLSGTISLAGLGNSPPFPDPAPNEVLTTAAQISFTPDGSKLVFTIKGGPPGGSGAVGIVDVAKNGRVNVGSLVVTEGSLFDPGMGTAAPFGFDFDSNGNLILTQVGSHSVSSYGINANNTLSPISGPVQISATGGGADPGEPGIPLLDRHCPWCGPERSGHRLCGKLRRHPRHQRRFAGWSRRPGRR